MVCSARLNYSKTLKPLMHLVPNRKINYSSTKGLWKDYLKLAEKICPPIGVI